MSGDVHGFCYASLVGKEELEETISEIKKNSFAKTPFEKAQEQLIIDLPQTCRPS